MNSTTQTSKPHGLDGSKSARNTQFGDDSTGTIDNNFTYSDEGIFDLSELLTPMKKELEENYLRIAEDVRSLAKHLGSLYSESRSDEDWDRAALAVRAAESIEQLLRKHECQRNHWLRHLERFRRESAKREEFIGELEAARDELYESLAEATIDDTATE